MEWQLEEPNIWQDYEKGAKISQTLVDLKSVVEKWAKLEKEWQEIKDFYELGEEEGVAQKLKEFEKIISAEEIKIFLSGEHDKANAILTVYSGAGGTEAQDWANMLLRMYLRYAERTGFKARVLDVVEGQGAGIKNATVEIAGSYAYGHLKGESGVHRLVRLSPFSASNLRHTSFALVEVLPEFEEAGEMQIKSEDLRIDTYRSSGPGGQSVNKTESAVRITHLPSGLVAACQSERSQAANKERAMKLLYTKLHQLEMRRKEEEQSKLRGQIKKGKGTAEWGSQIRSYVLHPYKMVKDLRTEIESKEPDKVLDGDLEKFIEAELRSMEH